MEIEGNKINMHKTLSKM